MAYSFLSFVFLFCYICAFTQDIKGRIIQSDAYQTPLFGATITVDSLDRGAVSGINGFFTIDNLTAGTYTLHVRFIGFKERSVEITIPAGNMITVALDDDVSELSAIVVQSDALKLPLTEQAPVSSIHVADLPMHSVPRLMGEPDLIRLIQNLPGVKAETDFTGGFSVRGGRDDQNLILLDGVPVYNPWHLFGLFSAFNMEAIKRVDFNKGVFPAQYGSRVSSVLDIELQKGDKRLGAGYLTVSPLSSSFSYGRPLNQKTSYLVSLRRTYMDPVFWIYNSLASSDTEETKLNYHFTDLNLKVVHDFNPHLALETGLYFSDDLLRTKHVFKKDGIDDLRLNLGWKNATVSSKLLFRKEKFQSNTHVFLSFYRSENSYKNIIEAIGDGGTTTSSDEQYVLTEQNFSQVFTQKFNDFGTQQDFSLSWMKNVDLHFGAQWLLHHLREDNTLTEEDWGYPYLSDSASRPQNSAKISRRADGDTATIYASEISSYLNIEWELGKFSFFPGVRLHYYTLGNYLDLLPRFNANYQIDQNWLVSIGYGWFTQYVQSIGLDAIRVPGERWFWANETRKPLAAKTVTAGLQYEKKRIGKVSLEGYYKEMEGLVNFNPRSQIEALDTDIIPRFSQETVSGSGESYGVEVLYQKTEGEVTGWLGYTLSWAWNQFGELSAGQRFPTRTDKRHDIQTSWNWNFARNWDIGVLFTYKTGQPVTFSTSRHLAERDPLGTNKRAPNNDMVVTRLNGFRLPAYHRLDINLTWRNRRILKRKSELSLNVFNIYNRFNILAVSPGSSYSELPNGDIRVIPSDKYFSQIPIVPVLSCRISLGKEEE